MMDSQIIRSGKMKKTTYGMILLALLSFVNANAAEEKCIPEVTNNMVIVELFNASGEVIYSQQHTVSPNIFYSGSIWADKATIKKLGESSGSNKVILGEKKKRKNIFFKTIGRSRTAYQENGTPIAKIGGCPFKKIDLFTTKKKEKPFVFKGLVEVEAPIQTKAPTQNKSKSIKSVSNLNNKKQADQDIDKINVSKVDIKNPVVSVGQKKLKPFGIPLGKPFSKKMVSKVIRERKSSQKNDLYVEPKVKNPLFNQYIVRLREKMIYEVMAIRKCGVGDQKTCIDGSYKIGQSLIEKYGNKNQIARLNKKGVTMRLGFNVNPVENTPLYRDAVKFVGSMGGVSVKYTHFNNQQLKSQMDKIKKRKQYVKDNTASDAGL